MQCFWKKLRCSGAVEVKSERKVNHLRSNNIRQFGSIVAQFESSNQITHNNSISNLRRDIKEETTKLSQPRNMLKSFQKKFLNYVPISCTFWLKAEFLTCLLNCQWWPCSQSLSFPQLQAKLWLLMNAESSIQYFAYLQHRYKQVALLLWQGHSSWVGSILI